MCFCWNSYSIFFVGHIRIALLKTLLRKSTGMQEELLNVDPTKVSREKRAL